MKKILFVFVENVVDWDPKGHPLERVREIRDEVDRRVKVQIRT